jgi:hypothetical protein
VDAGDDFLDDPVGFVRAELVVEAAQLLDGGDDQSHGALAAGGLGHLATDRGQELRALVRGPAELARLGLSGAGAMDADDPVGEGRLAIGVGIPAPGVLEGDDPVGLDADRIAGAVRNAAPLVGGTGREDHVVACLPAAGLRRQREVASR